ncbi:MAG: hydrogenase formation protein HypD [Candidatus Coatesbacteria bacterium]|nr:hydrogenase formation protein HypD [Candidatus Coatesbacteria bacterium]
MNHAANRAASAFRSKELVAQLAAKICEEAPRVAARLGRPVSIMEVCGTHTVAIYRYGLKHLLPPELALISGPGCPICVTGASFIDHSIRIASTDGVDVATFGDMVNVPGSDRSLADARAEGGSVRVVLSPLDALTLAANDPSRRVVFLAVGFETTAPSVAATVLEAERRGLENFYVLCAHKLVPPILNALLQQRDVSIDGLILPGHVSTIIGSNAYKELPERYGVCCAVTGFEPVDVLAAIVMLLDQLESRKHVVANEYARAVRPDGNPQALHLMHRVFEPKAAVWRGIGPVDRSGLALRDEFAGFDAAPLFAFDPLEARDDEECRCGDVLLGRLQPDQCPLFGVICTPESPRGPCMVSSEGTCSACYRYGRFKTG